VVNVRTGGDSAIVTEVVIFVPFFGVLLLFFGAILMIINLCDAA